MTKPNTQYTKSGRLSIAYQVLGDGPIDMVYVPGWVSNIDLMWRNPELSDFLVKLSKQVRLILFDKRGTGLSDRVTELSTLEERMDDIRAVMDAVGSQKAILFGHSEGGSVCALFAATYPQRTISLITFGVFAKRRYAEDYPWAPTDEERQEVYDMIETSWGSNEMDLASLAPSRSKDPIFMEWLASYFRSGASPSAALVLTKMNTQVDIIDILQNIDVPTLLLYRTDDIDVKVEEGKFIADRIKHSKFIEFPGNDHLFWVGNAEAVLREMIAFIRLGHQQQVFDRVLATILKVGFQTEDRVNITRIEEKINQYRGTFHSDDSQFVTATFDGPSKAVHCALEIRGMLLSSGIFTSQAIHIGECLISEESHVGGSANQLSSELWACANSGEILISSTVKNLLFGSGVEIIEKPDLDHLPFEVLAVKPENKRELKADVEVQMALTPVHNYSFLENVLQSIEEHLTDEHFGVELLCKEVGTSERQLQRKLKRITNKSPNQLVRSVRLHKAKELILQKNIIVSEAAYQTGFNSMSYFTKCFKKEFGYPPSQIKEL